MTQLEQEAGGKQALIQPPPAPPSFPSLPDLAHASIASFLPDGNKGNDSRLCVAEASRALLESYGGTLTRMCICCVEEGSAARLAALLGRNKKPVEVIIDGQEAIPALCQANVQGGVFDV